jgi:hypothetical protein
MLESSSLVGLLIFLLVVFLICGLVVFLIRRAPFIEQPFKAWAEYAVVVVAVLIVIIRLLQALGVSV